MVSNGIPRALCCFQQDCCAPLRVFFFEFSCPPELQSWPVFLFSEAAKMSSTHQALPERQGRHQIRNSEDAEYLHFLAISSGIFNNIFNAINEAILPHNQEEHLSLIVTSNCNRIRLTNRAASINVDVLDSVNDFLPDVSKEIVSATNRKLIRPSAASELFTWSLAEIMQQLLGFDAASETKACSTEPRIPQRLQHDIDLLERTSKKSQRKKRRLRKLNCPRNLSPEEVNNLQKTRQLLVRLLRRKDQILSANEFRKKESRYKRDFWKFCLSRQMRTRRTAILKRSNRSLLS